MITLRECLRNDPFDQYPQLASIWPEPFASLAREGVSETMDEGGLYIIEKAGQAIGITGFYTVGSHPEQPLYLRWHGLVESERGQGLSAKAIAMVMERGREAWPGSTELIEMAPLAGAYGEGIERHFKKLNFQVSGAVEYCDWSRMDWVPLSASIDPFLAKHALEEDPAPVAQSPAKPRSPK